LKEKVKINEETRQEKLRKLKEITEAHLAQQMQKEVAEKN